MDSKNWKITNFETEKYVSLTCNINIHLCIIYVYVAVDLKYIYYINLYILWFWRCSIFCATNVTISGQMKYTLRKGIMETKLSKPCNNIFFMPLFCISKSNLKQFSTGSDVSAATIRKSNGSSKPSIKILWNTPAEIHTCSPQCHFGECGHFKHCLRWAHHIDYPEQYWSQFRGTNRVSYLSYCTWLRLYAHLVHGILDHSSCFFLLHNELCSLYAGSDHFAHCKHVLHRTFGSCHERCYFKDLDNAKNFKEWSPALKWFRRLWNLQIVSKLFLWSLR